MRSKPLTEGVKQFKELWATMSEAAENASRLSEEIESRQAELADQNAAYLEARTALFKLMAGMDMQSNGNYGYENRMTWFLVELYRQTVKKE